MVNLIVKNYKQPKLLKIKNLHKNWIFVFESEGGGTEFQPIKTKCVNINFKKFFREKLGVKTLAISLLR